MALSPCKNGPTHDRHKARNWRLCGRRVFDEDSQSAGVSRSVGDPFRAVINPEELAKHYTRFRVTERILLTGHSHQAWPDVAFAAQQQAWLDAAEHVDDKWDRAFAKADRVRAGFARLLDDPGGDIALAASTHDLIVRFLSALPLARRPRLVTTDGEFHTVRRQLDRLSEEGIEVVRLPSRPVTQIPERLRKIVTDRTAA